MQDAEMDIAFATKATSIIKGAAEVSQSNTIRTDISYFSNQTLQTKILETYVWSFLWFCVNGLIVNGCDF